MSNSLFSEPITLRFDVATGLQNARVLFASYTTAIALACLSLLLNTVHFVALLAIMALIFVGLITVFVLNPLWASSSKQALIGRCCGVILSVLCLAASGALFLHFYVTPALIAAWGLVLALLAVLGPMAMFASAFAARTVQGCLIDEEN